MNKDLLLSTTRQEVDQLLESYSRYKTLEKEIASGAIPSLANKIRFSFMGGQNQNLDLLQTQKEELERIGNEMKFQNPLIWLTYKYEAYKNEPGKALVTISDLVRHCQVDGICHKRFDAINGFMRKRYDGMDICSPAFINQVTPLETLAKDDRFLAMCLDEKFNALWGKHENSPSGKWKEYTITIPNHDCEIRCTC